MVLIPIPVGNRYRATMRGRVPKLVPCEQCGLEYVYLLERTVTTEQSSFLFLDNAGAKRRAAAEAEAKLQGQLGSACDPVPCPACGRYQAHMVPMARKLRYRWMGMAALVMLPLAPILGIAAYAAANIYERSESGSALLWLLGLATAAGLAALGVPGFPILKFILSKRYDPNVLALEKRQALGQRRAVSKEEFLKRRQQGRTSPR